MATDNQKIYYGLPVQYNYGKEFLMDMTKLYPDFNISDFKNITLVAYPVVFFSVSAIEKTMEDFSLIEQIILTLIKDGLKNPKYIANALGITQNYVEKVISILVSYGQIDDDGITENGSESLKEEKSIKTQSVAQIIQVDGLTGNPISIDNFINKESLRKPKNSGRLVAHLEPIKGVEEDWLKEQLYKDYTRYINKGKYSLHTNVVEIKDVQFIDLKYAKAFLLEDYEGNTDILCKIYDSTEKDLRKKFGWKIVYSNRNDEKKYGFKYSNLAEYYSNITTIISDFTSKLEKKRMVDEHVVRDMLNQLYEYDWNYTFLNNDEHIALHIEWNSFRYYDKIVLKMLESISEINQDIIMFDELYGKYIVVTTNDNKLKRIADEYRKKCELIGRNQIMNVMERMSIESKKPVFELLKDVMENLSER